MKMCPRCKVRPKARQCSYCTPCNAAYRAFRRKKTASLRKAQYQRKSLNIKDTVEPSDPNAVPWIGWHCDRRSSISYGQSQLEGDNTFSQLYLMGHYAVVRFWVSMNGTAWEMGPDLVDVVDGQMLRGPRNRRRSWRGRLR